MTREIPFWAYLLDSSLDPTYTAVHGGHRSRVYDLTRLSRSPIQIECEGGIAAVLCEERRWGSVRLAGRAGDGRVAGRGNEIYWDEHIYGWDESESESGGSAGARQGAWDGVGGWRQELREHAPEREKSTAVGDARSTSSRYSETRTQSVEGRQADTVYRPSPSNRINAHTERAPDSTDGECTACPLEGGDTAPRRDTQGVSKPAALQQQLTSTRADAVPAPISHAQKTPTTPHNACNAQWAPDSPKTSRDTGAQKEGASVVARSAPSPRAMNIVMSSTEYAQRRQTPPRAAPRAMTPSIPPPASAPSISPYAFRADNSTPPPATADARDEIRDDEGPSSHPYISRPAKRRKLADGRSGVGDEERCTEEREERGTKNDRVEVRAAGAGRVPGALRSHRAKASQRVILLTPPSTSSFNPEKTPDGPSALAPLSTPLPSRRRRECRRRRKGKDARGRASSWRRAILRRALARAEGKGGIGEGEGGIGEGESRRGGREGGRRGGREQGSKGGERAREWRYIGVSEEEREGGTVVRESETRGKEGRMRRARTGRIGVREQWRKQGRIGYGGSARGWAGSE
ncbi:hypothetical protein DFH09DRAFT_1413732 [Mycena vulgaris]|nr:hypothetical protein DFH09DRAFT_1413732 [Mycena vulgaris]